MPREPQEAVETIPLIENDVRELIDEAHATEALLKANYIKPDLRKIANKCKDLDENQKEKLYQVLVKHEPLFQGTKGNYTGPPVTLRVKPESKPRRSKPYSIPLKNREVFLQEMNRQCEIGAMRKLTPKEAEEREWASPAPSEYRKRMERSDW